jgi:ATP-dependent DNA helicase RecQ
VHVKEDVNKLMEISPQIINLTPETLLKDYFGFDQFRPLQSEIIDDLVKGIDQFILMPTGGGKSICYQIPALIRKGVAIIVSPLISLMEDQVTSLQSIGINCAYYNSSLSSEQSRHVLSQLHSEKLDLLYIAPERLLSDAFMMRLEQIDIALFAIDEAHCISQWGHEFRPEYARLGQLKQRFPSIPIIATTATADEQTRKDIIKQLAFDPTVRIASFDRPNIQYSIIAKNKPIQQLQTFLSQHKNQAGIIYCATRKKVEYLTEQLKTLGYKVQAYHAGLPYELRRKAQFDFQHDFIDIVVATIAFGMGVDKSNVRYVVHYDLPKSIESYYQETGRAGRDGLSALVLTLFDLGDSIKLKALIETQTNQTQKQIAQTKLNSMIALAQALTCRRRILLNYFNESMAENCDNCDNCTNPPQTIDATQNAQKALSCIYRLNQNYGMGHVIDVLRGSQSEKVLRAGHDKLSTYNIGKDLSLAQWKTIIWQLIHLGFCKQDIENFGILRLTEKAIPLLKGTEKIQLLVPCNTIHKDKKSGTKKSLSHDRELFELLRNLRRQIANDENKPPFMIFSDATLVEMAAKIPLDEAQLLEITGVGKFKLDSYGHEFLQVIIDYRSD